MSELKTLVLDIQLETALKMSINAEKLRNLVDSLINDPAYSKDRAAEVAYDVMQKLIKDSQALTEKFFDRAS